MIKGVDWVTANHASPAVANMSLGGGISSALDTAVNNSIASGVSYAIAAVMICSRRSSEVIRRAVSGADSVVADPVVAFTLDMLSVDYYSRAGT